jgi:UDP-N-acetylglucosamine 2-epimerase
MILCSVVGTRPNFVKEFLMHRELKSRRCREILIHTGQHYDFEMSQVFFEDFDLPKPDFHLEIGNQDNLNFTAEGLVKLGAVFRKERPDVVLGYGDVNSTAAAALASVKIGIPFAHVEGGIRSRDLYNPEEINRRVSDVVSDVIYCCTANDIHNLEREGYDRHRMVLSGDLMKDALLYSLEHHDIPLVRGDYMVLTLHRQENVTDPERLSAIVEGLIRSDARIIFPAHPRTMKSLESFGLLKRLAKSRIELIKPQGYLEFLRLAAGADKILTDSGGVRREAYLMRKPCIVLIELSWFPEIAQAGWKVLTGPDPDRIAGLVRDFEPTAKYKELFGDGKAHKKIADDLLARYEK